MPDDRPRVVDSPEESRFLVETDGQVAELVYREVGNRLVLEHTGVPDAIGGRGLGGLLIEAAVERAVDDGLTLVPHCPYAARWLRDHPDAAADVSIEW